MKDQLLIAVDGHDGSGKTTISKLLAETIKGKYVKPFSGDVGDLIVWLYMNKNYELLEDLAFNAIQYTIYKNVNEPILVFDRHWLSIASLLPSEKITRQFIKPITFLCWANINTTLERLFIRSDDQENAWDNKKYCDLYYRLGIENNVILIDTSNSPNPTEIVNDIITNKLNYYLAEREERLEI